MADLVLGPLLRYVDDRRATVWAQADGPCEVGVAGRSAPTSCVGGRHVAIVDIDDLPTGVATPYSVLLDGERRWPLDDGLPPSSIRTVAPDESVRIAAGSCRVTAPHEPPYSLPPDRADEGVGVDALEALPMDSGMALAGRAGPCDGCRDR